MSNLSSLVQGLSGSLNEYLKANQQQARDQQNAQFKQGIDQQNAQFQSDLSVQAKKTEEQNTLDMAGKVTPDYAKQLFGSISPEFAQAASNAADAFYKQNNRYMTTDEANKALDPIMKALEAKENNKSNTKHYMGNDPKGNAIFADGKGQMFSPDGSLYAGVVLPKSSTMPTASTRSSAEFASTIMPHIQEMRGLIKEADSRGYIGPAAGRVYGQFLAGKVGSTGDPEADQLLGRLKAMDSLLKTGAMRVHFGARGGQQMYDHFSEILNSGKQSASLLNGSLDTLEEFMQGYANAGQPQGTAPLYPQGGNTTATPPTANRPPLTSFKK